MELLILDTSKYDDPLSNIWHAGPRYTASFLRRRGIAADVRFVPVLRAGLGSESSTPLALYFEMYDDTVAPSLEYLVAWRRMLPDTRFFIGGTTGIRMADALLRRHSEIDGIVIGECDATLAEVMLRLKARQPIAKIPGLRVRHGEFVARALIGNLDDLGMMVRDGLDSLFQQSPPSERVAYLLAGRGCYANCSFCSVPAFIRQSSSGSRWRGRSVGLVADEMEAIAREFGVRSFVFQDDNFFAPGLAGQKRAKEFAMELLRRGLDVVYFVTCRVNDIDAGTLSIMKASGLTRIGIGVESLNQPSLSLFRKGYRADAIYPALKVIGDVGIACEVNLIFFEPLMSLADVRRNLDFMDYVAKHEWLSYSDAFPFKTLFVAPSSDIAIRLAKQDALDHDGTTCRFRDQRVAALAEFANRLHACMPVVFKQRSVVASKDGLRAAEGSAEAVRVIASCTAQLREWLGLTVLPSYIRAAYNVVDQSPDDFAPGLSELEASFDSKMAVLRRLGRRLEGIVAERTGAPA